MSQAIALPFTSRTYVVLAIARGIAASLGHADLTGCHVALGLLREAHNAAVDAIGRAGISLPALLHDLETALPDRGNPVFGEIELPVTPGERAIVDAALSEARARHDEYVGAEHLLLALLRDTEDAAARVFLGHGLTYETAVQQLASVFGGQPLESGGMRLGAFSASLPVNDIEASRTFYEKFGFEPIAGDVAQNWLILKNGSCVIGLFQGMLERITLTFNPGWDGNGRPLQHFTDIRDLQRALKKAGVELLVEADETTTGPAYFTAIDPDGNPILLDQHL